ncbi:hypothetical protein B0J14DRAFT_606116 [Halenospora varia]|nr:hypothetical protein B0J14DRAFT_606116 [Halenospora varia]
MRAKLRDSLLQVCRRFVLCNEAKSSVCSTIMIVDGNYGHDTDGFPLAGGGGLGDSGSSSIEWTTQPIMWDYQMAPDPANSHLYTAEASYASETNGYGAVSTYGTSALMNVEYEPFDRNPTQQAQLQTPKSLGWREDFKFSDYYDFNVPKGHDLRFTLRSEFPASPFTPRTVYLDNVDNENYLLSCHACQFPSTICWRRESRPVFHRRADLERHYNQVHATDNRLQFHCDYQNCNRKNQPFTRKDHIRDHYIDYHKEDVGKWAAR